MKSIHDTLNSYNIGTPLVRQLIAAISGVPLGEVQPHDGLRLSLATPDPELGFYKCAV